MSQAFPGGQAPPELETLRVRLSEMSDADRSQCLVALLVELASGRGNGRAVDPAQFEQLGKRVQSLGEDNARLTHRIQELEADVEANRGQVEAEKKRSAAFQKIIDEQRGRVDTLGRRNTDLETDVAAKNDRVQQLERENESFRIKLGRLEKDATDLSQLNTIEEDKRRLSERIRELQDAESQARADKDAEIARLNHELTALRHLVSEGGDAMLLKLWQQKLAPPGLAAATVQPTFQAAERLLDVFVDLTRFADAVEQIVKPFLSSYTKHSPVVKQPWEVYATYEPVMQAVKNTIAVTGSRPAGVLRIRLRTLQQWIMTGMLASDSAFASIAKELSDMLHEHVLKPDPNCKVKDFMKNDGPARLMQQMLAVRSKKLEDAHGGRMAMPSAK